MSNVFSRKTVGALPVVRRLFCVRLTEKAMKRNFYGEVRSRGFQRRVLTTTGAFLAAAGAATFYYFKVKQSNKTIIRNPFVLSASAKEGEVQMPESNTEMTLKRLRFEEYASFEYGGKSVMTPRDFLNSLIDNKKGIEKRLKKKLTTQDVEQILKSTHKLSEHGEDLFKDMGEKGIITYPEYLFLLTLLTKSTHGLEVAFRMLDLDGNATLGKTEFQELGKMLNQKISSKSLEKNTFTEETLPNTSLLLYFFGKSGKGQLTFSDMLRFTRNLQKEFWRQEFRFYSSDRDIMSGEKFAQLLLQSTQLDDRDVDDYLERLKNRQMTNIKVNLVDYIKFGEFLNNLEEFSIALKIYNVANRPVTQDEFKRAVLVATGDDLGDHIVNTVFQLFDIDGDGKLSQKEFLGLMKDRVNKRFATRNDNEGLWTRFTSCVKSEVVD